MPKGGKRPGAGRKKGSATKRTRAIADMAASLGITPLEVMLETMRAAWDARFGPDGKLDYLKCVEASQIAKDAAPYMHARLQTVQSRHQQLDKDGLPTDPVSAPAPVINVTVGHIAVPPEESEARK